MEVLVIITLLLLSTLLCQWIAWNANKIIHFLGYDNTCFYSVTNQQS